MFFRVAVLSQKGQLSVLLSPYCLRIFAVVMGSF